MDDQHRRRKLLTCVVIVDELLDSSSSSDDDDVTEMEWLTAVAMAGRKFVTTRGKPLWRHNRFYDVIMHSHGRTNERTLSYRCANLAMQLNVVKAITESSAVSLGFWRTPNDTDMQTT